MGLIGKGLQLCEVITGLASRCRRTRIGQTTEV
jgi:hypothetical protein